MPSAIVFEMLTLDQAALITEENRESEEDLEQILGWNDGGWPDFSMYFPIFSANPSARIYGANVPPSRGQSEPTKAMSAMIETAREVFETNIPLSPEQQTAREALQMAAHCDALPKDVLPAMVDFQRLRDAVLALTTYDALVETGGPVIVITGNGHARSDWGVPALLAKKFPEIEVSVIGQTEDDHPLDGNFNEVRSSPAVDRPDPCEAFN